jgi:hypothetical protein
MRRSINQRLRNAVCHWSRTSVVWDPPSKKTYAQLRARGHSHGRALRGMSDRLLKVLMSNAPQSNSLRSSTQSRLTPVAPWPPGGVVESLLLIP